MIIPVTENAEVIDQTTEEIVTTDGQTTMSADNEKDGWEATTAALFGTVVIVKLKAKFSYRK